MNRKATIILSSITLLLFLAPLLSAADPPPKIYRVRTNTAGEMQIVGEDLTRGLPEPTVTLGNPSSPSVPLTVIWTSRTTVAAKLPSPTALSAGTYLLTLTNNTGQSATIDFTYPAKGNKGDQGDTGPRGPQGFPGVNGINGKDGINGTNGTNGKDGSIATNLRVKSETEYFGGVFNDAVVVYAQCNSDEKVVGGGCMVGNAPRSPTLASETPSHVIVDSHPVEFGFGSSPYTEPGWLCRWVCRSFVDEEPSGCSPGKDLTAYALCAR